MEGTIMIGPAVQEEVERVKEEIGAITIMITEFHIPGINIFIVNH